MRGRAPPSEDQTTWCVGFAMAVLGFLIHGRAQASVRTRSFSQTLAHCLFSPISPLALFFSSLRLFVVLHLPGLFECINQSSHSTTAITHLVRIREGERAETMIDWERPRIGDRGLRERKRGKEDGDMQIGSCSAFIHLLIFLLTSRLFISLFNHPFIHPSAHSANKQPCTHSFTHLWMSLTPQTPT